MKLRALLCAATVVSSQLCAQAAVIAPRATEALITGFSHSSDKLLAVGERGHLFTFNNVATQQAFPSDSNLNAISVAESTYCAVGYGDKIFMRQGHEGPWKQVNAQRRADGALFDVALLSPSRGLAVGSFGGAFGMRDGKFWEQLTYGDFDAHFYQVKPDGKDGWYVAGELGNLFRVGPNFEITRRYGREDFDQPTFFGLEVLGDDEFIAYGMVGRFIHVKGDEQRRLDSPRAYSTFASLRVGEDLLFFGADGTILLYRDGKLHDRSTEDKRVIVAAAVHEDTLVLGTVAGLRELALSEVLR